MDGEAKLEIDVGTELAHRLIRSEAGDNLDPCMIHGHPNLPPDPDKVVRACFYYAAVFGPKVTVLYDNWGEGGMCKMVPHEWRAVWKTPELLAALGTTFGELKAGTARLNDAPVPPPKLGMEALDEIASAAVEAGRQEAEAAPVPGR